MPLVPYFICPSCAWRGNRTSRTAGFSDRPLACEKCGFGFLFELMDDYFPSPLAGIFVCDQQGRVLAFGHGARELSGFNEDELMGSDLSEALELQVLCLTANVQGKWVRGHSGVTFNELVDKLADEAKQKLVPARKRKNVNTSISNGRA